MKNIKLLLLCIYTSLLTTSIWAQTNVVKFLGGTPESGSYTVYLRFDNYACKGDSIIAFKDDLCYYSYNKGVDWSFSNIRNQLLLDEGLNYGIVPKKIFFKNSDVIIFSLGKFFISKNFGKTFYRISSNKSLKGLDNEIAEYGQPGYHDVTIEAGYFLLLTMDGIFKSKDCNKWEKLKMPEGIQATKLAASNNDIFIATLKNIYKSSDYGEAWKKLDFIAFRRPVDVMRNLGGVAEMIAFDNKIYLNQISTSNTFTYVYDILTETETQIENIKSVYLKEDTLYLLSEYKLEGNKIIQNGEIFYYINSLQKSSIDLSNTCSKDDTYLCGIKNFKLTNDYIIIDGKASLSITKKTIK